MPHIHEKIDFTVEVVIVFGQKVLLRKHDKYNKWLTIGGHVDLGEDPIEAAHREVKEEVGLGVELVGYSPAPYQSETDRELIPPKFMNRHRINETHEHVTLVYFGRATSDQVVITYEDDASEDWKWFTKDELSDPEYGIDPKIQYYAQRALEELGN